MQESLNKISVWCKKWKLATSPEKSILINFSRKRSTVPPLLKICDKPIPEVKSLKILGIIFDPNIYRTVACFVTGSSRVPLKIRRVGQRCTLNLSKAETSSRWCGVVVRRGGCQLRCRPRHLTMVQNYVVRRQKPSCS
ncbi:uncharacterized protein TNCV_336691 [Trichonephila clavipes]|nr:uncharacterized protein TNCV_336691 [Trichonephila clavipes]